MAITKIYHQEIDVANRLKQLDLDIDALISVARVAAAARADTVDNDPLGTGGQLSYIYGTRRLREVTKPSGWELFRNEGVEAVRHLATGIVVVFQNVEEAAAATSPKAISEKGGGSRRLINSLTLPLFPLEDYPESFKPISTALTGSIWYLCVSVNDGSVSAELSQPAEIRDKNFGPFNERIFLIQGGDWGIPAIPEYLLDDAVQVEPTIARK
jgi:hypothetical protein